MVLRRRNVRQYSFVLSANSQDLKAGMFRRKVGCSGTRAIMLGVSIA